MDMTSNAIVITSPAYGTIICLVNVIIPGLGTFLASVLASERGMQYKSRTNQVVNNTILALLQVVLVPYFLVGWFWSIYVGYEIFKRARYIAHQK